MFMNNCSTKDFLTFCGILVSIFSNFYNFYYNNNNYFELSKLHGWAYVGGHMKVQYPSYK